MDKVDVGAAARPGTWAVQFRNGDKETARAYPVEAWNADGHPLVIGFLGVLTPLESNGAGLRVVCVNDAGTAPRRAQHNEELAAALRVVAKFLADHQCDPWGRDLLVVIANIGKHATMQLAFHEKYQHEKAHAALKGKGPV